MSRRPDREQFKQALAGKVAAGSATDEDKARLRELAAAV